MDLSGDATESPPLSLEVNLLCQPLITWETKPSPKRLRQREQVHLNGGVDDEKKEGKSVSQQSC